MVMNLINLNSFLTVVIVRVMEEVQEISVFFSNKNSMSILNFIDISKDLMKPENRENIVMVLHQKMGLIVRMNIIRKKKDIKKIMMKRKKRRMTMMKKKMDILKMINFY